MFAELGFEVVAIDYSKSMIEQAKKLRKVVKPPRFIVMDMTEIGNRFQSSSFDGAWVNASLYHVEEINVRKVLSGLRR